MSKIHTTGTDKTTFHHNGDFSGFVTITIVSDDPNDERVSVPFDDLEYIVTEKKRKEITSFIENLDLSMVKHRRTVELLYMTMLQDL